jgi:signal transduction histidine kinase
VEDQEVADLIAIFGDEFETMRHLVEGFHSEQSSPDAPLLPEEIVQNHKPIDFSELVQAEVKLWRRLLRLDIKILRYITEGVQIRGDKCELHEIVHNLFKNAVQAMQQLPEDERRIIVTLLEHDDFVQVLIQDNGPGIPEEAFAKLFRLGFTKDKKGGTGIGLYQARRLARKMGGDVTLINNVDREDLGAEGGNIQGATAVIELPKIIPAT